MKFNIFSLLLLVGLAISAPVTEEDDEEDVKLTVNKDFFVEENKIYEGKHDIVKIRVPMNEINFGDDNTDERDDFEFIDTFFFVEADIKGNEVIDQGLYVSTVNKVTKLLDNGRDIAAPIGDYKTAYFAAKDGIYSYIAKENSAEKYGSIDEDLIGITIGTNSRHLYVLSADKKVYKVIEEGDKLERVKEIDNADQILVDYKNNLFYMDSESKNIYVLKGDVVKKVEGLPQNAKKYTLLPPNFTSVKGGIIVVADNKIYDVDTNGITTEGEYILNAEVSTLSVESLFIPYFAREKKIYEFNIFKQAISNIQKLIDILQKDDNFKRQGTKAFMYHKSKL